MNLMEQEAMKQSLVTSYVQYMRVSQRDTYGLAIQAARACFYARVSIALNVLICTMSRENANQLIQEWLEPLMSPMSEATLERRC